MSKIISIGTSVPQFRHEQTSILHFMEKVYAFTEQDKRKLRYLYQKSEISSRYSVLPDYSRPVTEWKFYPQTENLEPFPSLELRMSYFNKYAARLSVDAIRNCIDGKIKKEEITHLITVSCTGMSAPGLDLQVLELMDLPKNINRTSINFMGCYAAIHGLKMADAICRSEKNAKVIVVCTELCTLHFQREATIDNITSSMLFGDGSAAVFVTSHEENGKGIKLEKFYSEVIAEGKRDMAWELSSTGFLMTLSMYIPDLIQKDFKSLFERSLSGTRFRQSMIKYWCVHPGGKKILESLSISLDLPPERMIESYEVLRDFGNMSSATILFVLKKILLKSHNHQESVPVFGAAFGPGLTLETFVAST